MDNIEIPDWIIKYDKANYQSGAGKAVRFLMEKLKELVPSPVHKEEKMSAFEKAISDSMNESAVSDKKEEIKTAEDILYKHLGSAYYLNHTYLHEDIFKAMEEYANQFKNGK